MIGLPAKLAVGTALVAAFAALVWRYGEARYEAGELAERSRVNAAVATAHAQAMRAQAGDRIEIEDLRARLTEREKRDDREQIKRIAADPVYASWRRIRIPDAARERLRDAAAAVP